MELKEGEFSALFAEELQEQAKIPAVLDCTLETDLEALIPETYVSNAAERLRLYARLDRLHDETALQAFLKEIQDQFGPLPMPVQTLTQLVKLRWLAQTLGLTKLKLKNGAMRCYFSPPVCPHQDSILARVFVYVQQHPSRCRMQEISTQLLLIIDQVGDIEQAHVTLGAL